MEPVLTSNWKVERSYTLDVYERRGGYAALRKALQMAPDAIVDEVKRSNLRGRGGAGFPTGVKWSFLPKQSDVPKYLVVKKGEHGALLFSPDRVFFAPALPLEDVVDPTGAGDTFAGGFIGFLARTQDHSFDNLKRAIIVGSALASFTCEKFGIERLVEITREDIDARIQQFVELVDFDIELVED